MEMRVYVLPLVFLRSALRTPTSCPALLLELGEARFPDLIRCQIPSMPEGLYDSSLPPQDLRLPWHNILCDKISRLKHTGWGSEFSEASIYFR